MDLKNIFKNSDNNIDTQLSEILRYMGCKDSSDNSMRTLSENAKNEVKSVLKSSAVWRYVKIENITENTVDFGFVTFSSKDLASHLKNCSYAVFMVATIGNGIDMLIKKHSVSSMSYALCVNSAGASYIESYCDYLCDIIGDEEKDYFLTSRFSPGYEDLDLKCQKEIFSYLDAPKNTGVYLNESFMMMPSKSVCAIIGLSAKSEKLQSKQEKCNNKCLSCKNYGCNFRKGTKENENNG